MVLIIPYSTGLILEGFLLLRPRVRGYWKRVEREKAVPNDNNIDNEAITPLTASNLTTTTTTTTHLDPVAIIN